MVLQRLIQLCQQVLGEPLVTHRDQWMEVMAEPAQMPFLFSCKIHRSLSTLEKGGVW